MAIRPTGDGDVTESHVAWRTSRAVPKTPSMLLVGQELYMVSDNGIATCLDARSGELHWRERLPGNFSASPLYANDRIYLLNEAGTGIVLKAGTDFQKLAENPLEEQTLASYGVASNALFIRTAKYLYRIEKD